MDFLHKDLDKSLKTTQNFMNALARETPLYEYELLNQDAGFPLHLKLENLGRLGSTSARGYLSILALSLFSGKTETEMKAAIESGKESVCFALTRDSPFRVCVQGLTCTAQYAHIGVTIFFSMQCLDLATLLLMANAKHFGATVKCYRTDGEARRACEQYARERKSEGVVDISESPIGEMSLVSLMTVLTEVMERMDGEFSFIVPSEAQSFHGYTLASACGIYLREKGLENRVSLVATKGQDIRPESAVMNELQEFTFNPAPDRDLLMVFDEWDKDKNGVVSGKEVAEAFAALFGDYVDASSEAARRSLAIRILGNADVELTTSEFRAMVCAQVTEAVAEFRRCWADRLMEAHLDRYEHVTVGVTRGDELRALKACLSHTHTYSSGLSNHALACALYHSDKLRIRTSVAAVVVGGRVSPHVFENEFAESLRIDRQLVRLMIHMSKDPKREADIFAVIARHHGNTVRVSSDLIDAGLGVVLRITLYTLGAASLAEIRHEVLAIPGVHSVDLIDTPAATPAAALPSCRKNVGDDAEAAAAPIPPALNGDLAAKGFRTVAFDPAMCGIAEQAGVTLESVEQAYLRLQRYRATHETLVYRSNSYSKTIAKTYGFDEETAPSVYLMLENTQQTGSFKVRGASSAIAKYYEYCTKLREEAIAAKAAGKGDNDYAPVPVLKGVLACSAGNHGSGVSKICSQLKLPCCIVCPETAPATKLTNMRRFGAEIVKYGVAFDQASAYGAKLCDERSYTFVPPFNSWDVIEGQATIAYELLRKQPDLDTILINVGGGGLISGIALYAKQFAAKRGKPIRIVGIQADVVHPLRHYKETGELTFVEPSTQTLADGCNVKVCGGIHNDVLYNLVDEYVGVAENEIAASMTHCLMKTRTLTEGGGVMGLTALLYKRLKLRPNEKVAVVLCGGNLDLQRLSVISRFGLKALGQCVTVTVDVPDAPGQLQKLEEIVAAHDARMSSIIHIREADGLLWDHVRLNMTIMCHSFESINNILISFIRKCGLSPEIVDHMSVPNDQEVFKPFNDELKAFLDEKEKSLRLRKEAFEKNQKEHSMKKRKAETPASSNATPSKRRKGNKH